MNKDDELFTIPGFTASRVCRFCGPVEVEVSGDIETTRRTAGEDMALAAYEDAEKAGWKSGACPHCAWEHRKFLMDEARAERGAA